MSPQDRCPRGLQVCNPKADAKLGVYSESANYFGNYFQLFFLIADYQQGWFSLYCKDVALSALPYSVGTDRALTHPAGGCRAFSACLSGGGTGAPPVSIAAGQSPTATLVMLVRGTRHNLYQCYMTLDDPGVYPAYLRDGTEPHLYIAVGQSPTATIVKLLRGIRHDFFRGIRIAVGREPTPRRL